MRGGVSLGMLDYAGRTPLMNATVGGVGGTVELVLARGGANPDCRCHRDQSLLLPAAKRGCGNVVAMEA